jgi:hypothetical protein
VLVTPKAKIATHLHNEVFLLPLGNTLFQLRLMTKEEEEEGKEKKRKETKIM